jgi:hypothetical protein
LDARQRAKLSRGNDVAKAIDYMLKRWSAFTRFLNDGSICLSNNAAERGVRGITLGRKPRLFCGSDRGGERAAVMYSLIVSALCRPRHKAVYAGPNYAERFWMRPIVCPNLQPIERTSPKFYSA